MYMGYIGWYFFRSVLKFVDVHSWSFSFGFMMVFMRFSSGCTVVQGPKDDQSMSCIVCSGQIPF